MVLILSEASYLKYLNLLHPPPISFVPFCLHLPLWSGGMEGVDGCSVFCPRIFAFFAIKMFVRLRWGEGFRDLAERKRWVIFALEDDENIKPSVCCCYLNCWWADVDVEYLHVTLAAPNHEPEQTDNFVAVRSINIGQMLELEDPSAVSSSMETFMNWEHLHNGCFEYATPLRYGNSLCLNAPPCSTITFITQKSMPRR